VADKDRLDVDTRAIAAFAVSLEASRPAEVDDRMFAGIGTVPSSLPDSQALAQALQARREGLQKGMTRLDRGLRFVSAESFTSADAFMRVDVQHEMELKQKIDNWSKTPPPDLPPIDRRWQT